MWLLHCIGGVFWRCEGVHHVLQNLQADQRNHQAWVLILSSLLPLFSFPFRPAPNAIFSSLITSLCLYLVLLDYASPFFILRHLFSFLLTNKSLLLVHPPPPATEYLTIYFPFFLPFSPSVFLFSPSMSPFLSFCVFFFSFLCLRFSHSVSFLSLLLCLHFSSALSPFYLHRCLRVFTLYLLPIISNSICVSGFTRWPFPLPSPPPHRPAGLGVDR